MYHLAAAMFVTFLVCVILLIDAAAQGRDSLLAYLARWSQARANWPRARVVVRFPE